MHGHLIATAPLLVKHGLWRVAATAAPGLISCGAWASLLHCLRDLPESRTEPVYPALAGRFFTAEPPGRPILKLTLSVSYSCLTKHIKT